MGGRAVRTHDRWRNLDKARIAWSMRAQFSLACRHVAPRSAPAFTVRDGRQPLRVESVPSEKTLMGLLTARLNGTVVIKRVMSDREGIAKRTRDTGLVKSQFVQLHASDRLGITNVCERRRQAEPLDRAAERRTGGRRYVYR